jgi:hypothetical protein
MRTVTKLQDIQVSLYRFRVARGRYLSDIPYEDLCREEITALGHEAEHILFSTRFELRLVRRRGKKVWRFLDRL